MHAKLAFAVVVAASLFAATASAQTKMQTEPAAGAPTTSNAMASMEHHRMHHHWRHHHMGAMGYSRAQMDRSRPAGRPVSRKAAGT